jgi:hypothetical protein
MSFRWFSQILTSFSNIILFSRCNIIIKIELFLSAFWIWTFLRNYRLPYSMCWCWFHKLLSLSLTSPLRCSSQNGSFSRYSCVLISYYTVLLKFRFVIVNKLYMKVKVSGLDLPHLESVPCNSSFLISPYDFERVSCLILTSLSVFSFA